MVGFLTLWLDAMISTCYVSFAHVLGFVADVWLSVSLWVGFVFVSGCGAFGFCRLAACSVVRAWLVGLGTMLVACSIVFGFGLI